ncbi:MAG: glycosyltransferase [Clostridia bacterium]|nr:glycosyltransferase [Clostridia bacterium]
MKALIVASVASMIDQFNRRNIALLQSLGYEVTVATNFVRCGTITSERCQVLKRDLAALNVTLEQVDFPRSPAHVLQLKKAIRQLKAIAKRTHFDLVHCHSPIGALVSRWVFRKYRHKGTRVIYTAHGFHFCKGSPIKNWILYYPIEKICSKWTDELITINQEDYELAKRKMKAGRVEYVPGVGIDTETFANATVDKDKKREELGIPKDAKVLLSVGELNDNKNHQLVIKAIAQLGDANIHYVIAGQGCKEQYLRELALKLNVNLHLLGFREDVKELYKMADVFVFPSKREGLPVALMEAIASECVPVASRIRGNVDLVPSDHCFNVEKTDELRKLLTSPHLSPIELDGAHDINAVQKKCKAIYRGSQ